SVNLNAQNKTPAIDQIKLSFHSSILGKWESGLQAQNTRDGYTFYPDVGSPQEKKLTLMTQNCLFSYVDISSTIGAQMIHVSSKNKDMNNKSNDRSLNTKMEISIRK
ncbi:unnamed protein product, partial [Adineta steineri]